MSSTSLSPPGWRATSFFCTIQQTTINNWSYLSLRIMVFKCRFLPTHEMCQLLNCINRSLPGRFQSELILLFLRISSSLEKFILKVNSDRVRSSRRSNYFPKVFNQKCPPLSKIKSCFFLCSLIFSCNGVLYPNFVKSHFNGQVSIVLDIHP